MILILHNIFQIIKKGEHFPTHFLRPAAFKDIMSKENSGPTSLLSPDAKVLQKNISKLNPKLHEKNSR